MISSIRNELTIISEHRKEFTPVSELKQVKILLNTLESRLLNFCQLLHKLDSRRNILGTILQTLFGIATVSHWHTLNETLDELHTKNADTAHSLGKQVTYVQNLDRNVRVNSNAILNLSMIIKNELTPSHDNIL